MKEVEKRNILYKLNIIYLIILNILEFKYIVYLF